MPLPPEDGLRRKGERDAKRLEAKIRDAIRRDIRKYLTEEAVITSDGRRKVRIPVRGLRLPEFRFGDNASGDGGGRVGSASDDVQEGDRLVPAAGTQGAGDSEAEHILEKDVTLDELVDIAFDELGLPNLDDHVKARVKSHRTVYKELRRSGPLSMVDLRRTLKQNILRNARDHGQANIGNIHRSDLRFRTYRVETEASNNAVIVSMMDVSGSMTEHKKYLVRMCLFWIKKYLERIYDGLEFVFIIHDTRAQEVDEQMFFNTTTGGGTYISSAYARALEIIEKRYPPSEWNLYPFYFSDGENWEDDNKRAVTHARALADVSRMFYYGQVASTNYATFMKTITEGLHDSDKLVVADIQDEKDIVDAIGRFLRKENPDAARLIERGARRQRLHVSANDESGTGGGSGEASAPVTAYRGPAGRTEPTRRLRQTRLSFARAPGQPSAIRFHAVVGRNQEGRP